MAIWYLLRLQCIPRVFRLLWPFTYLLFYEYGTISRNYSIGIAFLLMALFYAFEQRRAVPAYLLLALAALTSVYCAAIAGAIGASWALFGARGDKQNTHAMEFHAAVGGRYLPMALLAATIIIGGLVALPPTDGTLQPHLHINWTRIDSVVAMFLRGVFLTPDVSALQWNGPHLLDLLGLGLGREYWLALAFVAAVAVLARRSPVLLAYWLMVTVGLVAVGLVTDRFEQWRHIGHAAVAFAVWYAMYCYLQPVAPDQRMRASAVAAIVTVFLAFNLVGTIPAVVADIKHPFSYGTEVARFIRSRFDPSDTLLLGYEDSKVSSVHAFAPQFPFIYVNSGVPGGYVRWGKQRKYKLLSQRHIIAAAAERGCVTPDARRRVLVSHMDPYGVWGHRFLWIDAETTAKYAIKPIAQFTGSLSDDEDIFLYELTCP